MKKILFSISIILCLGYISLTLFDSFTSPNDESNNNKESPREFYNSIPFLTGEIQIGVDYQVCLTLDDQIIYVHNGGGDDSGESQYFDSTNRNIIARASWDAIEPQKSKEVGVTRLKIDPKQCKRISLETLRAITGE